jgi:sortase (surface protein transpeptidase)
MVAKTWSRRPQSASLFSALAFAAVLALTLGSSWRDGAAATDAGSGSDRMNAELAAPAYDSSDDAIGRDLHSRAPLVLSAGSDIAAQQARIPTARPVQLLIPALDVHRAVERVGVNRAGVLNLPVNAWNAGWYAAGPVPGAPGDAVIEGHAGYPGQPMIFGKLVKLKPGDHIIAVLADGTRELFLVDSITTVPVGSAPAGMAEPYGPPRLTLITCTGHFDQNSYSYSRRLVLEASYAGRA